MPTILPLVVLLVGIGALTVLEFGLVLADGIERTLEVDLGALGDGNQVFLKPVEVGLGFALAQFFAEIAAPIDLGSVLQQLGQFIGGVLRLDHTQQFAEFIRSASAGGF